MASFASDAGRSRIGCRGWVTIATNNLDTLVKTPFVDKEALRDALEEFDMRLNALDNSQTEVEMELATEEELVNDIKAAAAFREKCRGPRVVAVKIMTAYEGDNRSEVLSNAGSHVADAKLPKLSLPKFSGDPLRWTEFWEPFEALIDNGDMSDIAKLTYLNSLLEGEAKATVSGLSLTAANYAATISLLKTRYGRPRVSSCRRSRNY